MNYKFFFLIVIASSILFFTLSNQNANATTVTKIFQATHTNSWVGNINEQSFTGIPAGSKILEIGLKVKTFIPAGSHTVTDDHQVTHRTGWDGNVWGEVFTMPQGSKVTSMSLKVFTTGVNSFVRVKIYDDAGGFLLLGESGPLKVSSTGVVTFPVSATTTSDSIMGVFETNNTNLDLYYTNLGAGAGDDFKAHAFGPGPANFLGGALSTDSEWASVNYVAPNPGVRVKLFDNTGPPQALLSETDNVLLSGNGTFEFPISQVVTATGGVWAGFETNSSFLDLYESVGQPLGTSYFVAHNYGTGPASQTLTANTIGFWEQLTYFSPGVTFSIAPTRGIVGSTVTMTGSGFTANSIMTIKFNGTTVSTSPTPLITDHLGQFNSTTFHVPSITFGQYVVEADDSGGLSGGTLFSVQGQPLVVLNSTNGNVGKTISASGINFTNNISTTWKYDKNSLATNPPIPLTNNTGGFTGVIFTIPKSVAGHHNVNVTDGNMINGSTIYNVTSSSTISPTSGIVGTIITVNGDGFLGSHIGTIKFDGVFMTNFLTNNLGSFSSIFTIPNAAGGPHIITSSDGSHSVNSTFILTGGFPSPVTDLHATNINTTQVTLAWSQPNLAGLTLVGYQINYTSPNGIPFTILKNNTQSSSTTIQVLGLTPGIQYSFRIGVWAGSVKNMQGNILDLTTLSNFTAGNFTIGNVNFNFTNTNTIPIKFIRTDNGTTTNLDVIYSSNFNLSCNLSYKFAQINRTYSNLASVPYAANTIKSTFKFVNSTNDVILVSCTDIITKTNGKYILTITNFPLIQQLNDFKAGKYGTQGQFGGLDLITLMVVVISMIGFNRVNEAAGIIFNLITLGALAYFGIIQWPTIIFGVLALVVMVTIVSHRKIPGL